MLPIQRKWVDWNAKFKIFFSVRFLKLALQVAEHPLLELYHFKNSVKFVCVLDAIFLWHIRKIKKKKLSYWQIELFIVYVLVLNFMQTLVHNCRRTMRIIHHEHTASNFLSEMLHFLLSDAHQTDPEKHRANNTQKGQWPVIGNTMSISWGNRFILICCSNALECDWMFL